MEGTLSVQPQANPVKGFQEYFLNLTVENNKRNPWFGGELDLLEHTYECLSSACSPCPRAPPLPCPGNGHASRSHPYPSLNIDISSCLLF